jgi:hypothetical protein
MIPATSTGLSYRPTTALQQLSSRDQHFNNCRHVTCSRRMRPEFVMSLDHALDPDARPPVAATSSASLARGTASATAVHHTGVSFIMLVLFEAITVGSSRPFFISRSQRQSLAASPQCFGENSHQICAGSCPNFNQQSVESSRG